MATSFNRNPVVRFNSSGGSKSKMAITLTNIRDFNGLEYVTTVALPNTVSVGVKGTIVAIFNDEGLAIEEGSLYLSYRDKIDIIDEPSKGQLFAEDSSGTLWYRNANGDEYNLLTGGGGYQDRITAGTGDNTSIRVSSDDVTGSADIYIVDEQIVNVTATQFHVLTEAEMYENFIANKGVTLPRIDPQPPDPDDGYGLIWVDNNYNLHFLDATGADINLSNQVSTSFKIVDNTDKVSVTTQDGTFPNAVVAYANNSPKLIIEDSQAQFRNAKVRINDSSFLEFKERNTSPTIVDVSLGGVWLRDTDKQLMFTNLHNGGETYNLAVPTILQADGYNTKVEVFHNEIRFTVNGNEYVDVHDTNGLTIEQGAFYIKGVNFVDAPSYEPGYGTLWVDSDNGVLYYIDTAGTEHDLLAGGGGSALDYLYNNQFSAVSYFQLHNDPSEVRDSGLYYRKDNLQLFKISASGSLIEYGNEDVSPSGDNIHSHFLTRYVGNDNHLKASANQVVIMETDAITDDITHTFLFRNEQLEPVSLSAAFETKIGVEASYNDSDRHNDYIYISPRYGYKEIRNTGTGNESLTSSTLIYSQNDGFGGLEYLHVGTIIKTLQFNVIDGDLDTGVQREAAHVKYEITSPYSDIDDTAGAVNYKLFQKTLIDVTQEQNNFSHEIDELGISSFPKQSRINDAEFEEAEFIVGWDEIILKLKPVNPTDYHIVQNLHINADPGDPFVGFQGATGGVYMVSVTFNGMTQENHPGNETRFLLQVVLTSEGEVLPRRDYVLDTIRFEETFPLWDGYKTRWVTPLSGSVLITIPPEEIGVRKLQFKVKKEGIHPWTYFHYTGVNRCSYSIVKVM